MLLAELPGTEEIDVTDRDQIIVTLEALPHPEGVPTDIRLKRLLKAALRVFCFRCVDIRPGPAAAPGVPCTAIGAAEAARELPEADGRG